MAAICPDFKWSGYTPQEQGLGANMQRNWERSKGGWVANGPAFEWDKKSGSPTL